MNRTSTRGRITNGRPRTRRLASEPVPVHPLMALARGALALAVLTNPYAAVAAAIIAFVVLKWAPRHRRVVAVAGTAAAVLGSLVGLGDNYLVPYQDIAGAVRGTGGWSTAWTELAAQRWTAWLLLQTPYALALATMTAGWWLVYRRRSEAPWRDIPEQAKPQKIDAAIAAFDEPPSAGDSRPRTADGITVRLGIDVYNTERVTVTGRACRQHGLIAGVTGYGKSRSIERLLHEFVVRPAARHLRVGMVFVDMKADRGLREAFAGAARSAGRRFHLVTVGGIGCGYNPIRHGSASEVRGRIVECLATVKGGGFTEPHHRESATEFLTYVVRALDELVGAGARGTFGGTERSWRRDLVDLSELMTLGALEKRRRELSPRLQAELGVYGAYLEGEGRSLKASLPGLAARVRNLVTGEGRRVLTETPYNVDLYDAIIAGDIVLFSLAADVDPMTARQIASLALTELGAVGGRLQDDQFAEQGRMFLAGVDEFSGLGGETVAPLFARLRSAGGSMWVCTQDVADLAAVSPEFAQAVLTNTNIKILHRQTSSAADLADLMGTYQVYEETVQIADKLGGTVTGTGTGSLSLVDRYHFHPNTLRELPVGEAVIVAGAPDDVRRQTRIALAPRPVRDQPQRPPALAVTAPTAVTKPEVVNPEHVEQAAQDMGRLFDNGIDPTAQEATT